MSTSRIKRIEDFEKFYSQSTQTFKRFLKQDEAAQEFERLYMLNVCPGSRNGGTNPRIVEISWGHRLFESIARDRSWQALTENGATLLYERSDTGHVIVSLYPAYTNTRKPIESSITLAIWKDPAFLNQPRYLQRHWNQFVAYMECTSLDGNPTWKQRLDVWYLRHFKHLIIADKWMPVKALEYAKDVLKYVLTVGLSGSIIYLVTVLTAKPADNKAELEIKQVRSEVRAITTRIDNALQSQAQLKAYQASMQRLEVKTDRLLKQVEKRRR
ncbi:hypothetical protein GCM10023185_32990 [Hymenobacter saemangeumensis]|uniref:Uncharacterized protein n=1 Tax=Hymenobacter saemangeumensis TaxID=1084522 RepID=A0ABP8IN17_9BACT